jgi:alkaline phosphatase D
MNRRAFLATASASTLMLPEAGIASPYLSRASERPVLTHGIQSGDVCGGEAVV